MPTIRIVVSNRVRVWQGPTASRTLDEGVMEALKHEFTHRNPEFRRHGSAREWITTWEIEADGEGSWLTFPRGGLSRVRRVLRDLRLEWSVADCRTTGDPALAGIIPPLRRPLWDFQEEAVTAAVARQNCLIRAPTGSGKTSAAFALAARVNLPTLVVLDDGGLFKQWTRRCVEELGMEPAQVGRVKGPEKSWRIGPITIASSMTLYLHPEFFTKHGHRFGMVIADEVQGFAAKTMFGSVDPLPAKYRVGISADESRKDRLEVLVYDLFGDVAADIPQSRVIASGNTLDVTIRVVPTAFKAEWYRRLTSDRSASTRARQEAWNRLLEAMTTNEARNTLAAQLVQHQAQQGHRVMVWSHRVEHCRYLDNALASYGVMSGLMLGGAEQSAEFERTREGLQSGTLNAGVGTVEAIGQAIDAPMVDRGVITTPLAANRQRFNQVRGRICRAVKGSSKRDAELYYMWDRGVHGMLHLQNLVKWYGRRVLVQEGAAWVPGAEWLKQHRADAPVEDDFEDVFVRG